MTSAQSKTIYPELETRFLPPPGWRWHMFAGHNGQKVRFGTVFPRDKGAKAIIIVLPGLSEFCEKYYELAHNLLDRQYAMYVIDWQGQGRSFRHLTKTPQKRISYGFRNDIDDLHILIKDYIKPSAIHPDIGVIPLVMLGHSLGANIGLRYLHDHPDTFKAAAFSAPFLGIKSLNFLPLPAQRILSFLGNEFGNKSYLPGGKDYTPDMRTGIKQKLFSSDEIRGRVHHAWFDFDEELRQGNITWSWIHKALKSCAVLSKQKYLNKITTPSLLAVAEKEFLVNNSLIRRAARIMPNAKLLELKDARHEILMEDDKIRNHFLKEFDELLKNNILNKEDTT